ncbi:MAG: hypothetical protein AAGK05_10210 [Pseudomonadota bacterium]
MDGCNTYSASHGEIDRQLTCKITEDFDPEHGEVSTCVDEQDDVHVPPFEVTPSIDLSTPQSFEPSSSRIRMSTGSPQSDSQDALTSDSELKVDIDHPRDNLAIASKYRRKRSCPEDWKANQSKAKRLKGLEYTTKSGTSKKGREIGEPCTSTYCKNSAKRDCESVTSEVMQKIFDMFWSMSSWDERLTYVKNLVERHDIKQHTVSSSSRRENSFSFFLTIPPDGKRVCVCKKLFCATFGVSLRTVGDWVSKCRERKEFRANIPQAGPTRKVSEDERNFLERFLMNLPTVDSHYCRNSATYKDKKFLYPGTKLQDIYERYQEESNKANLRSVSLTYFRYVFTQMNFSVFIPKKDQCDTCIGFKMGSVERDRYETHINDARKAREIKASDKSLTKYDDVSVWTMDTQKVLLCPDTKASAMYYRCRLQVHNLTFYNMSTGEGYCYVWDETQADLSSDVFASIQTAHFREYLGQHPLVKQLIVWSDNCCYQNKNVALANAYSALANETGVTIIQKYLVQGHTQMECDNMHSKIERNICTDICVPRDYLSVMRTARRNPAPYTVKLLSPTFLPGRMEVIWRSESL